LDVELEHIEELPDIPWNRHHPVEQQEIAEFPEVIVSNVVCQSSVNCALDLTYCCKHLKNSELNRKTFPALFVRLRNPAVTILIFSNGKLLATGGKTYEEDCRAMRRLVKSLHKLGNGVMPRPKKKND
jgi:TATA-box binding protein (TBP) (component of TFIID and TFIIIB)